jgi:hypothetical protein
LPLIAGSLGESDDGFSTVTPVSAWAQEFATPTAVSFSTVYTVLGNLDLGAHNDFALTASLYSVVNSTDGPDPGVGTLVGTFALNPLTPLLTSGFSTVEFDLASPVTLSSSLYYWFVLTGTSSVMSGGGDVGGVQWQYTTAGNYGPGSLPAYSTSYPGFNFTANYTTGDPFLFQAGGSAIPEPGSVILGGVGLSFALLVGLRSKFRGQNKLAA